MCLCPGRLFYFCWERGIVVQMIWGWARGGLFLKQITLDNGKR